MNLTLFKLIVSIVFLNIVSFNFIHNFSLYQLKKHIIWFKFYLKVNCSAQDSKVLTEIEQETPIANSDSSEVVQDQKYIIKQSLYDLLAQIHDNIEENESGSNISQHKGQYENNYETLYEDSKDLSRKINQRIFLTKKNLQNHNPPVKSLKSIKEYEKYMKSKRFNRNMFTSGLQGVWGIPGRK